MELWIGALSLGLLYAFMTMGVFITFRIHNFPDITVDGSFTAGAAIMAVLMVTGVNPFLALGAAFIIGAFAGCATALINTRLNVNGLLAGILVMTGLYSINLHIMGRSNIPLLNQKTLFTYLSRLNPGLHGEIWTCIALGLVMVLFWLAVSLFFKSDLGIAMRVTGNNSTMAAANGVNVGRMTIFGVALANGLVGISGGLVAQYQGFADIGMGIGTVVIGLAAVIIGESILRAPSMYTKVLSVIIGSVIFRLMIAIALFVGMNPIDLKLLTAGFVLITLIISKIAAGRGKSRGELFRRVVGFFQGKRVFYGLTAAIIIIAVTWFGYKNFHRRPGTSQKTNKIGVVQLTDNGLLNITRDSLVKELGAIGYQDGQNCAIMLENANGDLPTVNSIIDKFLQEKVDIVVTISTGCTQAAINKIKNRPIVFATVADPFIIGAGKSETDHVANVTGVYGPVPMDKTMEVVRKILPGKLTIGAIWDSAQANSIFNVENLQKAAQAYDEVTFAGTTITSSAEVYEAALYLAQKGIGAFVLPPDNIVYSAFESVVKAAKTRNIPVFTGDVERLGDGALVVVGFDYTSSGIQAAHLVDRVLKGESPRNIPFEQYRNLTFGIDLEAAKEIGISISPDLLAQATTVYRRREAGKTKPKIGIIQFALEPNVEICKQGILKALAENGYRDKENIEIIFKNAQADFSLINSIIQDFLRREVDIIIPLSTPCVQSAVQFAAGEKDTKVVFTYIFDPYRIGAAKTPTDHVPNMTGVACFPPIEGMLDLIKEMFPDRKKVGIVWNSSEANSEAVLIKIRARAAKVGLEVIEATVTGPAEVLEAARSLVNKGAQVFLNSGDNTVNVSFDSFVKVSQEKKIPVFSVDSEFIEKGSLAVLGPDYFQTGYEGGQYAAKVLGGKNIATIPIRQTKETLFMINLDVARKCGFEVDKAFIKRAQKVVDTTAATTPGQKKRLALFLFSDSTILLEAAQGLTEELERSGILKQHNMTIDTKNSQNEFYLAQSIAQDIVQQQYDYIITLSTPALQVMANTNKKIPHIFGGVTDPYRMGVAKSSTAHLPNVTGVATLQPVETTIRVMREIFPQAKRLGIIWNPAEACSEACTYKARNAVKKYKFDLQETNVNSTSEVLDALRSLLNRNIDLFLTSGDNTVIMALESVAEILKEHRIPYFTNTPSDVDRGAFVSIGADYNEVGRETARMAERVINGENPRSIPINNYVPEKMAINLLLAGEYGIKIPETMLKKAAYIKR